MPQPPRPSEPSCPERMLRSQMTDDEFWEHVFIDSGFGAKWDEDYYDLDHDALGPTQPACPVCGERGPCAWDREGNPLTHMADVRLDDVEG